MGGGEGSRGVDPGGRSLRFPRLRVGDEKSYVAETEGEIKVFCGNRLVFQSKFLL